MNSFAFSSLITGILSLFLSGFVYFRRGGFALNRIWSFVSFAVAFWSLGLFGVTFFRDFKYAYISQIILDISAIFVPVLFFEFVVTLIDKKILYKRILKFSYIFSLLLAILSITKFFKKGLKHIFEFSYWVDPGVLYPLFPIFFMVLAVFAVILLFKYSKSSTGVKQQQIKYVIYAAFIGFGGGIFNFLPQFSRIYPIGNYLVGFYIIMITYAIVKYRLMNIRLILTRSILYAILVAVVASFFALSVFFVGNVLGGTSQASKIFTYIINSFIIVIFLDPLKRIFAKITDRIFYKDRVDYQNILQQASAIVAREIDLKKLSHALSRLIAQQLKIKEVYILIAQGNSFELISSLKKHQKSLSLTADFIGLIKERKDFLIVEELIRTQSDIGSSSPYYQVLEKFIKEAESLKIEMVVPIFDDNNNLSSIFLFSSKSSGDLYNQDDINFLKILVPQIATAIAKSKLYEEVQAFNRELQAKVEARTKSLKEANQSLEERNKFLTTMQVITGHVTRTLDMKQVNQMIANSIALELGYIGGVLSFVDEENHILRIGALTENENTKAVVKVLGRDPRNFEAQLKMDYSLGSQTVLSGKINFSDKMSDFFSPPVEKPIMDQIQRNLGVKTIVGLPIFSENKIIGIIHFLLAVERRQVSAIDIEMMTALTNQVGIVSRNLRLYNNLQSANLELQEANMRLRELDKAKSEFLSIASHQLRTPISALKGYLSMMIDGDFGPIPDKIKQVIKDLFESASRLARLINVFLNVSRIESGRLKLEKHPLQVNDLIISVIKELGNQAEQKKLKLSYQEPKTVLPLVNADSDKLREVILNLIDNSIKYTLEGSITTSAYTDEHGFHFVVKDTGIGIDPEEAKTLFRKFVRGTGVAQIHTGGSGLGLFIAQKIIKEHGGQVWAESQGKGKGSTFQFVIPINGGDSAPETLPAPAEK
ncbi:MAG: ATP-binding protein [Patescibacteria group bacterium]